MFSRNRIDVFDMRVSVEQAMSSTTKALLFRNFMFELAKQ